MRNASDVICAMLFTTQQQQQQLWRSSSHNRAVRVKDGSFTIALPIIYQSCRAVGVSLLTMMALVSGPLWLGYQAVSSHAQPTPTCLNTVS